MNLTPQTYEQFENQLRGALASCASLSFESALNVEFYLQNAEIELAFESLLLSLNEEDVFVPDNIKQDLYHMGVALGIDKEGILIGDEWPFLSEKIRP